MKAKKGHEWMKLERIKMDCISKGKFEKRRPIFFRFMVCQFIHVSKCHLHSWKIILSCYVATILQMKDSWSAN